MNYVSCFSTRWIGFACFSLTLLSFGCSGTSEIGSSETPEASLPPAMTEELPVREPLPENEKTEEPDAEKTVELVYKDRTYDPSIRSARLFPAGLPLGLPLIGLENPIQLELHFDELGSDISSFGVSLIHCTSDWNPSPLQPYQYMDVFDYAEISNYRSSFNTYTQYIHYQFNFPTEEFKPVLSGNYLLVVYRFDDPDVPVISKRMYVLEPLAGISGDVKMSRQSGGRQTDQRVEFNVDTRRMDVRNAFEQISVNILQNNRWDNALVDVDPQFVRNNELVYAKDEQVFSAGKEYRWFDMRSLRQASSRIRTIEKQSRPVEVSLVPDPNNTYKQYFYRKDMNGRFIVENEFNSDAEVESDYALVKFTLPYPYLLNDGQVYVFGALSDWDFNSDNLMIYNDRHRAYETELLLKQGYYNYIYVFVEDNSRIGLTSLVEGNWHEAENRYDVFVYQYDYQLQYDRLTGHNHFTAP